MIYKNIGIALKRITFITFGIIQLIYAGGIYSQVTMNGGKGLFRVLSAETVNSTDIFVNGTFSAFYTKTGPEALAKYYCVNLNGTAGIAKKLELFLNIVPYQDDQHHIWGRFGDTRFGIKYLTPLSTSTFKFGLMGFYKFVTAGVPNVPYEIFSTDRPGWGTKALFTFDLLDVFPSYPVKVDLNFGYMDHDIGDQFFISKYDQLLFGTGFKFSIRSIQVYAEYSGEIFFNNPGKIAFGQNSMRITPGIRFLGPWQNTFDIALDFSLTSYDSLKNKTPFHKEYFGWKATIGVTHHFSVYKYFDKTAKLERQKKMEELKKLETIRKKREKANEDLEKMKEILDKKKSKEK